MATRLIIALILLLFSGISLGDDYFQKCESLLGSSSYEKLRIYLEREKNTAYLCQRLSDNEYIYVSKSDPISVFYYCDSGDSTELDCKKEDISIYHNLEIKLRFFAHKKQFVLFRSSNLMHGVFSEGFTLFHLVPKSMSKKGYALYSLPGAGMSQSQSDDVCESMSSGRKAISPMGNYLEILNEQKSPVIRFEQSIEVCGESGSAAKQVLEFVWKGNKFRLSKDSRIYE